MPKQASRGRRKQIVQLLRPLSDDDAGRPLTYFQNCLKFAGMLSIDPHRIKVLKPIGRTLMRAKLLGNVVRMPNVGFFAQVHRVSEHMLFPTGYFFESVIYAWDCWPYRYDEWESFFRRHRVKLAFISARQSAMEFQKRIPQMKTIWLPEGAGLLTYRAEKPLKERSIDVLELGRRNMAYHSEIVMPLASATVNGRNVNHMYLRAGRVPLFPGLEGLTEGYGDSKISVCFPASMTNPEVAGGLETVTLRYFEAMASRCILLGHCPAELQDFWGYNPVIEADLADPLGQLLEILNNTDRYQELVDQNYKRFLQVGTWEERAKTIVTTLNEMGYRV